MELQPEKTKIRVKVLQLNAKGKLVKRFKSLEAAAKEMEVTPVDLYYKFCRRPGSKLKGFTFMAY